LIQENLIQHRCVSASSEWRECGLPHWAETQGLPSRGELESLFSETLLAAPVITRETVAVETDVLAEVFSGVNDDENNFAFVRFAGPGCGHSRRGRVLPCLEGCAGDRDARVLVREYRNWELPRRPSPADRERVDRGPGLGTRLQERSRDGWVRGERGGPRGSAVCKVFPHSCHSPRGLSGSSATK
jgi:hypothetical protein